MFWKLLGGLALLGASAWLLSGRGRGPGVQRVALIGDSHSQALFPRLRPALEAVGRTVVLQESRPGWSLQRYVDDGVVSRIQQAWPDLVVVSLGGNDRPGAGYEAAVQQFVTALRPAQVLWNGPADTAAGADRTVAVAHDAARERLSGLLGDRFFDAYSVTGSGHRADGVHFDAAGYDRWAAALAQRLLPGKDVEFA